MSLKILLASVTVVFIMDFIVTLSKSILKRFVEASLPDHRDPSVKLYYVIYSGYVLCDQF